MNVTPEYDKTVVFRPAEGLIGFLTASHCEGEPNPLEDWDEMGSIHSFSHRHINFWKPVRHCHDNTELRQALDDAFGQDWVPLGYFEHGTCIWHVTGETPPGTAGDYRWDGVRFAGVWVPDEGLLGYVANLEGDERRRKLQEYARQACDVYTKWCNGEVYWYSIRAFQERPPFDEEHDYRFDEPSFEDSVGGYYGWHELTRAVEEALTHAYAA